MRASVLGCFIMFPLIASAQPPAQPPDPFSGEAALGYLAIQGNTESTNANATLELLLARGAWLQNFDFAAIKATNAGSTTAEAYSADVEARRSFANERSYLFMTTGWRQDQFSAYDRETALTAGYGHRLIDRPRHLLNGEIGAGARQAELRNGPEQDDGIARAAIDYLLTISETSSFEQDIVVESGSSNTSVEAVSALKARVVGAVSLVLSYRVKRNSDVPPGSEPRDTFTSIALEYGF